MDKDLEFLREMSDKELDNFIKILTHDKDGDTRWTEELTSNPKYKENYPQHSKYIVEAVEEFQKFGGNTIANVVRGNKGVSYDEILNDVCDSLKIKFNETDSILDRECYLLKKCYQEKLEELPEEEIKKIAEELSINITSLKKEKMIGIILSEIFKHGSKILIPQTIGIAAGIGITSFVATQLGARFIGSSIMGPIGWGISAVSLLPAISSSASRVTIPATLQIAYLRQLYFQKQEEKEMNQEFNVVKKILDEAGLEDDVKLTIIKKINSKTLKEQKLNILIVGGTGVGKSSTINALFEQRQAKVGISAKPETEDISSYNYGDNFTIYDSPGIGDDINKDTKYLQNIKELLTKKLQNDEALIDLVLIIIDAGSRDFSACYRLVQEITPILEDKKRILIAMNKCDRGGSDTQATFDYINNKPSDILIEDLEEKVKTIKERIKKSVELDINVIYYSAGETRRDGTRQPPYKLAELLYHILESTPKKKRFIYRKYKSSEDKNYQSNRDDKIDSKLKKSFFESIWENVKDRVIEAVVAVKDKIVEGVSDYLKKKI